MFDPWDTARINPRIHIRWSRTMRDDLLGATNGVDTIWLNRRILTSQSDRRCTLTHELVHLNLGHQGHQPEAVEKQVRAITAQLLITRPQLVDGLGWTRDLYELAEHLWVTPPVLRDRLEQPDARALMERAHFQEWT